MTDLASLDRATDYTRLCEAMWPDLPQRYSEGHIWMPDPRDPDERTDAFSINVENGMWCNHKTGDTGNMLTLVAETTKDWALWAAVCPEALPHLPGKAKGGGLGLRAKKHPAAVAASTESEAPEEVKSKSYAEEMKKYARMEKAEWVNAFAEEWGVPPELLREHGSCFAASRGRTAGKPVYNLAMCNPGGAVVGIKSRALEAIWASGGKARKSNNRGKVGLVGYPDAVVEGDERPLLLVEGEKDFIVARHHLGEHFHVVGNLGGAGTFKEEWADAIRRDFKQVYICYDNDENEAGWTGARKACRKLWSHDLDVHPVFLPVVGQDIYDFLRGKEEVCEAQDGEALLAVILAAEPMDDLSPAEAKAVIQAHLDDAEMRKDDLSMSRALFAQLLDHGGRFYHDGVAAWLLWQKKVYQLDSGDTGWAILQGDLSGLSPYSPVGARVTKGVRALAIQRGGRMEPSAWQARRPGALYLPLYNAAAEIVKITPDEITVVENGHDDVVLMADPDTKPIQFLDDKEYDEDRARNLWDAAFGNLNLTPGWQQFVSAFGMAIPFYAWCQTHPQIRFQGPAGSGKSTAFVFIDAILSGNAVPVGGLTQAGMWRLASKVPVVALDDLEAKQLRREPTLKEFFLRAAVGGQRVMAGEEVTQTVRQNVVCWLISNGISPITGNEPALAERVIVVPMLDKAAFQPGFYAKGIADELVRNRSLMWNFLFRQSQRILRHLERGAITHLIRQLPQDKRQRLHEFFALLSVALGYHDHAAPFVDEWLEETATAERVAKHEGSALVTLLLNAPAYLDAPDEQMAPGAKALRGINTHTDGNLWTITEPTNTLHTLFTRMRKDTGIPYHSGSPQELGNDLAAVRDGGADEYGVILTPVKVRRGGKQTRMWRVDVELDVAVPIGRPKPTLQEENDE